MNAYRFLNDIKKAINVNSNNVVIVEESKYIEYSIYKKPHINEIQDLLNLNYSDFFENFKDNLFITISSNHAFNKLSINKDLHCSETLEHIESTFNKISTEEFISLKIKIYKKILIDQKIYESFNTNNIDIILSKNYKISNLKELNFINDYKRVILIYDQEKIISNGYLTICNINTTELEINNTLLSYNINQERIKDIISISNQFCNFTGISITHIPDNLYYNSYQSINNKDLRNFLMINLYNSLITMIANITISKDNYIYSIIKDDKEIHIEHLDLTFNSLEKENEINTIYNLYLWIYKDGINEKIIITRKVLVKLLCNDCGKDYSRLLMDKSFEIQTAIINNFDEYLEGNIKEYFKAKEMFINIYEKKSNEIYKQIEDLISTLNKNLLLLLGTLLTSLIALFKENNFTALKILLISFIGYIVLYNLIFIANSIIKYKMINSHYKINLEKILSNKDGDKHFSIDDTTLPNLNTKYFVFLCIHIFIVIMVIVLAIFIFYNAETINHYINTENCSNQDNINIHIDRINNEIKILKKENIELNKSINILKNKS